MLPAAFQSENSSSV